MHQGNWKCSACGGAITELPFEPRSETGLTCRACWSKSKNGNQSAPPTTTAGPHDMDIPDDAGLAGAPDGSEDDGLGAAPITPGNKPKFTGDWSCAGCGASITSLPFSPRDTSNLKCIDCFKASKG
jgi:CxxC-x17-CxxC domain-containing protein